MKVERCVVESEWKWHCLSGEALWTNVLAWYLRMVLKDRWEELIAQEGRRSRRDSMCKGPERGRELRSCVFTVA